MANMKFTYYKTEETMRKNAQLEKDLSNYRHALEQERNDKASLFAEYQKLKEHLASCERYLAAA